MESLVKSGKHSRVLTHRRGRNDRGRSHEGSESKEYQKKSTRGGVGHFSFTETSGSLKILDMFAQFISESVPFLQGTATN